MLKTNSQTVFNNINIVFLICLLLAIINGYVFNKIAQEWDILNSNNLDEFNPFVKVFIIAIAAPIVETFLFQSLPYLFLKKLKITNYWLYLIIPSIVFSLFHTYNLVYFFMAFFGGIILNGLYIHLKNRSKNAFMYVCLLHCLYNIYGFLFVV